MLITRLLFPIVARIIPQAIKYTSYTIRYITMAISEKQDIKLRPTEFHFTMYKHAWHKHVMDKFCDRNIIIINSCQKPSGVIELRHFYIMHLYNKKWAKRLQKIKKKTQINHRHLFAYMSYDVGMSGVSCVRLTIIRNVWSVRCKTYHHQECLECLM